MDNLEIFQISESNTIKEAFAVIDRNQLGAVFVVDSEKRILGIATDGDIRRWLIKNPNLDTPVAHCMNTNFIRADINTAREQILKLLDHKIQVVPRVDEHGRLVEMITPKYFPLRKDRRIIARAKSPVRISFGGGGTDLTHYFIDNGGAVMNAAISIYSHAILKKRNDQKIIIYSHDLKVTAEGDSLLEIAERYPDLALITSLIRIIKPNYGFELQVGSDFPMGSGLGGSAVVLSAIIGCFNEFRSDRWDNYEIAEIAFQAERLTLDMAGGWQDQYATVFGGFNFMEFTKDQNVVHPLRLSAEMQLELEESLLLCYVGGSHKSGDIHKNQKTEMQKAEIAELVEENKVLTYKMKNQLLKGHLLELGKSLDRAWRLKRQFSEKISNGEIDAIYDYAMRSGAVGGKLLGAGGGGYFIFYTKPFSRFQLESALMEKGLTPQRFKFDEKGLQSWTIKDDCTNEE